MSTSEIGNKKWQRQNRAWRRWLRHHLWFATKRGRKVHALKAEIERFECTEAPGEATEAQEARE